jgi:hypothetical protein
MPITILAIAITLEKLPCPFLLYILSKVLVGSRYPRCLASRFVSKPNSASSLVQGHDFGTNLGAANDAFIVVVIITIHKAGGVGIFDNFVPNCSKRDYVRLELV